MDKIDVKEVARQTCVDYYQKKYFQQPKIDRENLRVPVENFEWNGAVYRIDVFFLHQKPSFLPYYQNFWMAHKIWMTKNGKAVHQEPVYTSNAVHPELSHKANEKLQGFFPGNYYFKKEMDNIDLVLKNTSAPFTICMGPNGLFPYTIDLKKGIRDLERIEASIFQLSSGYKIVFEGEKYGEAGLSMHDISFLISYTGECSELSAEIRNIPGLC